MERKKVRLFKKNRNPLWRIPIFLFCKLLLLHRILYSLDHLGSDRGCGSRLSGSVPLANTRARLWSQCATRHILHHIIDHGDDEFGHASLCCIGYLLTDIRVLRQTQIVVSVSDRGNEDELDTESDPPTPLLTFEHTIDRIDFLHIRKMLT